MIKQFTLGVLGPILLFLSLSACKTSKINQNLLSHDKPDSTHSRIWQDYEVRIQKRDKLSIQVTALNQAAAEIFNFPGSGGGAQSEGQGYIVDADGKILLPRLGLVKAEGYTRNQLRDTLMNQLRSYLNDPLVFVNFVNLKVTMLGEVSQQGPIPINNGKITILEALGQAGNVTSSGRRDSILVIREINNTRQFGYVNLLSNEAFKSPYFMLQQNDIVYVPLLKSKASLQEERSTVERALPFITALTSLTSLFWVIYSITR